VIKHVTPPFPYLYLILWLYLNLSICVQLLNSFGHYILSYWWGNNHVSNEQAVFLTSILSFTIYLGRERITFQNKDKDTSHPRSLEPSVILLWQHQVSHATSNQSNPLSIYHRHYKYNMVTRYVYSLCLNYLLT
jgi:hypothetical protein